MNDRHDQLLVVSDAIDVMTDPESKHAFRELLQLVVALNPPIRMPAEKEEPPFVDHMAETEAPQANSRRMEISISTFGNLVACLEGEHGLADTYVHTPYPLPLSLIQGDHNLANKEIGSWFMQCLCQSGMMAIWRGEDDARTDP